MSQQPAKRRIVPLPVQTNDANTDKQATVNSAQVTTLFGPVKPPDPLAPPPPPGRRMYVNISAVPEVDWKKLLKAQGVSAKVKQPVEQPVDQPADPLDKFKQPKQRETNNIFANVIRKLESTYMAAGSSSESSESEDSGPEQEGNGKAEASDGDASDVEPDEQFVSYDEDFIDDSELLEYKGGRKKTKLSGFFINKGQLEVVEPVKQPTPTKSTSEVSRKRKAKNQAEVSSATAVPTQLPKPPKQPADVQKRKAADGTREQRPVKRPKAATHKTVQLGASLVSGAAASTSTAVPEAVPINKPSSASIASSAIQAAIAAAATANASSTDRPQKQDRAQKPIAPVPKAAQQLQNPAADGRSVRVDRHEEEDDNLSLADVASKTPPKGPAPCAEVAGVAAPQLQAPTAPSLNQPGASRQPDKTSAAAKMLLQGLGLIKK